MSRFFIILSVVFLFYGCGSNQPETTKQPSKPAKDTPVETDDRRSSEPDPDTIFSAAANGQLATVMRKLEEGQDVNVTDDTGMTALSWAALRGRSGVVRYLLEKGADPNIPDEKGLYPLHKACLFGDKGAIQSLVDFDADVNAEGPGGLKAVQIARRMKHDEIVEILETAAARTESAP